MPRIVDPVSLGGLLPCAMVPGNPSTFVDKPIVPGGPQHHKHRPSIENWNNTNAPAGLGMPYVLKFNPSQFPFFVYSSSQFARLMVAVAS